MSTIGREACCISIRRNSLGSKDWVIASLATDAGRSAVSVMSSHMSASMITPRVAYVELLPDERGETAAAFFRRAVAWYERLGVKVERVLTDNGTCYRSHLFAAACRDPAVRHLRTRPYTPRTNGKAERLIQTLLREWAYRYPFRSSVERQQLLNPYLHFYNHHRMHSALSDQPPISRLTLNNVMRRDN
jgi:transposase InsO family protein